jgi:hypothetical protein
MLRTGINAWQRHPVLVAAGAGALLGGGYTVLIEIGGFLHRNSSAVLPLMFPAVRGSGAGQMNAIQAATLLLVEVIGNVVGFAILFSVPVAVAVGALRLFKGRRAQKYGPPSGRP